MWLRRAFYGWLIPAAFLLPLWLLIGWGVFNAGGWAFLWVLFLAIPGVFLWQLLLTLLVRARGTVRLHRAVSWWDVLGFAVWHLLVISLGFFDPAWWAAVLVVAIARRRRPVLARAVAAVERGEADPHGLPHDRRHLLPASRWRPSRPPHSRRSSSSPRSRARPAPDPFWPVAPSMAEWLFVP